MYTINIFSTLIQKYPSFQELQSFLTSEEGGNLRIIFNETNRRYVIFRYVKGQSDLQKEWVLWFRSVVWDTETNRPLCVAPRKAMFSEIPSNQSPIIEDFVEGVMVNGFLTEKNQLEWTTRSKLGANSGYYSLKTFAEMMEDALSNHMLKKEDITNALQSKNMSFVSFVLQHPDHRVVQKTSLAKMYCIHLGSISTNGDVTFYENNEWPETLKEFTVRSFGTLPAGKSPMEVLNNSMNAWATTWQGLVFRGQQGQRWRYRTAGYTLLRELRGKESRPEERFVRLRSTGKVLVYLKNWNEDKQTFSMLEAKLRNLTKQIYFEYCNIHKVHRKTIHDVDPMFKGILYQLHGIYLNELRAKNETLKFQDVVNYINKLPLEGQASLLRQKV